MSEFNVFDADENPQQAHIYDRSAEKPGVERVLFPEDEIFQGADINEALSIEAQKRSAVGDMSAAEGDKISGAEVIVDKVAGTVTISDGVVYSRGSPRTVAGAVLTGVSMISSVSVGYVITKDIITADDDPDYLGVHPGIPSFEEEGATRTVLTLEWAVDDGSEVEFYPFVDIINGDVVSQDVPATLSGVAQQVGRFIQNSLGSYITKGCNISALGLIGDSQNFAIEAGAAYVNGLFVYRPTANRHTEVEAPELLAVPSEPHTYVDNGDGTATITLNNGPIKFIDQVIVTKLASNTISKGIPNGQDDLPDSGVTELVGVVQGGITYVIGTDCQLTSGKIEWIDGGNQPVDASTYVADYHYYDDVTPSEITDTQITIDGGVDDEPMLVEYQYALPRKDCICLNETGYVVYLKGVSASNSPLPPQVPDDLLKLGEVHNTFSGTPTLVNNGTRNAPFDEIRKMFDLSLDTRAIALNNRAQSKILQRSAGRPTGNYSDPLIDDSGRDAGGEQTAAVFNGTIQLNVEPTFVAIDLGAAKFLDFVEEPVIEQALVTGCVKINPYQNFTPLPVRMSINPSTDFWTESQENRISGQTQMFGSGNTTRVASVTELRSSTSQLIDTLREIDIEFSISDFGPGEILTSLTFDGLDVMPAGLVADSNGEITGTFTIPANVSAGDKAVGATGGAGRHCSAVFTGQGVLEVISVQTLTTVERLQVSPVVRNDSSNSGDGVESDPQAQSFVFTGGRHIPSIDLKICAIGDDSNPVILELVTVDNGFPTTEVIAQTELSMVGVLVNQITKLSFEVPTYLPSGQMFAFVVKSNDADHSISIADRGGFDEANQKFVGVQPYVAGTRFSSSNAVSWTVHQDSDITYTINGCLFTSLTRRIELGIHEVVNVSDIIIGAKVSLPTVNTSVLFELTFGDETPLLISPNQPFERDDYFTGNLKIALIINGTAHASPIVGRDVTLILGTIASEGVFTSTLFPVGGSKDLFAGVTALLPGNATVGISFDDTGGTWLDAPQVSVAAINNGFKEHEFQLDDVTLNPDGRMKITITGGPGARPSISTPYAFVN